jgi:hypothetical protein
LALLFLSLLSINLLKIDIDASSIAAGWVISILNAVAGSYILVRNSNKETRQFFNVVLGSMVLRIFVIVIMVFIGIKFLGFEEFSFAISLFFFYFIFLALELKYISKFFKKA